MVRSAELVLMMMAASAVRHRSNRNGSIAIVNGKPAEECEWKHQVGVRERPGKSIFCGGTLITSDWVLSAAHCFAFEYYDRVNVVAGEWHTEQNSANEQNSDTSQIFKHPKFSRVTLDYDFALLKLKNRMTLNNCVGTAKLPARDVADGTSCWITGWGTLSSGGSDPEILQEAQVKIINNRKCGRDFDYDEDDITERMLCANGRAANGGITDACQGDSGGPFVCQEGGSWVVHGATSWGNGCADRNAPGVWARVYNQLTWIEETMSGIFPTPAPTPAPEPTPPGQCKSNSSGPDKNGDCKCDKGFLCYEDGTKFCYKWSGGEGSSHHTHRKKYLPSCSSCVCRRK